MYTYDVHDYVSLVAVDISVFADINHTCILIIAAMCHVAI